MKSNIKTEIQNLTSKIKELKYLEKEYHRLNYSYSAYELNRDKSWWWRKVPIRIWHDGVFIFVTSSASITDEMLKNQEVKYNIYLDCIRELHLKQYLIRHLFIVYGHFKGKTRDQIEPKFNECRHTNYNYIMKRHVQGNDPIDWGFIWELKKEYLPQAEERP